MNQQVTQLKEAIRNVSPSLIQLFEDNEHEFGHGWVEELEDYLSTVIQSDADYESLAQAYAHFVYEDLLRQVEYERTGVYTETKHDLAVDNYYANESYMFATYMPALSLSHHVWPHHYRLFQFFKNNVLNDLSLHQPRTFCEVGVGGAIYSMATLRRFQQIQGTGYDILEAPMKYGQVVIQRANLQDRFTFVQQDILEDDLPQYDFVICQEVLEHLEDPATFCKGLAKLVKVGGHIYVTAALTANSISHLHEFKTIQEIYAILEDAQLIPLMFLMDGARKFNDYRYRGRVAAFYCVRIDEV